MSALTKFAAWVTAAAALSIVCQATAFGQDINVATATPAEAPAQLLSEAAQITGNPLTLTDAEQHSIHIFPTVESSAATNTAGGPLIYHGGGSIMPRLNIYAIFWKPATLQNGNPAAMTAAYRTIQGNLLEDYVGHGIYNNNTQYYQIIGGVTSYVSGLLFSTAGTGSEAAAYLDTASYPASGCTDVATPGNCITDAQLQTELQRVMALKGWTGGLDKIFVIYTAQGEGSCFTASSATCAYKPTVTGDSAYCAYHGAIGFTPATAIIYANIPYGNPTHCQVPGTPSPNANPSADTATTAVSHELTEAVTDPLLNAWYDSGGNEIGDICAYNYATNSYDSGLANQSWNGRFYELQQEYDNHAGGCVQIGP